MPRALNLLRHSPHYRRDAFDIGLSAAGFKLVTEIRDPASCDLVLMWNRYGANDEHASIFERAGARVLVVENCPLGNDLHGGSYSIARSQVAMTGGGIRYGGPERWDSWGINLQPWRTDGETVILGQRGIGNSEIRSPHGWSESVQRRIGGRIRPHPGTGEAVSLWEDLKAAGSVVTWSSGAAIQALAMGVPVWYEHPAFVGGSASKKLSLLSREPKRDDAARLEVFRRLAWAIWTLDEISSGKAIDWMLV